MRRELAWRGVVALLQLGVIITLARHST